MLAVIRIGLSSSRVLSKKEVKFHIQRYALVGVCILVKPSVYEDTMLRSLLDLAGRVKRRKEQMAFERFTK
jgi:hypothetical protein